MIFTVLLPLWFKQFSVKKAFQFIGSYVGIGFMYFLSFLPHFILYGIADIAYFVMYKVLKYRVQVVNRNLRTSFPEKSTEEIQVIQKAFYHNLMDVMVETVKEFSISKKQMMKRYRFINPEEFNKHYDNNKSVMMLMGHYGNWEYGVSTPLWVKHDCWAVYGKLQSPVMDKEIVRVRERFGHKLFDMGKTYDVMLGHDQGDKLYMFMADQSPHKGSIKYWLNFFKSRYSCTFGC